MTEKLKPTQEEMAIVKALAEGTVKPKRAPIVKTPADHGLEYEDTFFPALGRVIS